PDWIVDFATSPTAPRAKLAGSTGIRSGFGFPVAGCGGTLGALTFYSSAAFPFEGSLLETFSILAREIEQFLERRRVEKISRENEWKFRAIFDQTVSFIGLTTPEGVFLEVNQTLLDFGGIGRDEAVGVPCWDSPWVASPESRVRLKSVIAEAATGRFFHYEGMLRGADDRLSPIDFSVKSLKDESGQVVVLLLEGRDLSAQKRAAEELRLSERRFRGAFDAAAIGMSLVAPDGRWVDVNQSLCGIVGYTESELLASNFQAITHPDDLEKDLEELTRTLAGEISSYRIEKRYFHKNTQVIWVDLSVSLVRDGAGQPLYFVSQIVDITPRKRAEEERRLSESTIRSLFDSSPQMMGVVELRGNDILHVSDNAATAAFFGIEADEMRGRLASALGMPEAIRRGAVKRCR
ncbi:PAS domain S-box protein, partial [Singulisphaera rosea]